jgi:hypothetical protein
MSRFRAHRADYELLMTMLRHDEYLTFVNSALTLPEDPGTVNISPVRIAEYRNMLSKLGRGSLRYDPSIGTALFSADAFGDHDISFFPIRSAAFAKEHGLPLDRPPKQAHHIEDDWYLASEHF